MIAARREPFVLVADDDRDTRELYRACFDTYGYHTAEAGTGSQALVSAVEIVPDVLVTDYVLPDIDGVTVAQRLRGDPRTARIRILMVTGYAGGDVQRRAAAAGIERVLLKPCLPQAMMREVTRALTRTAPKRPYVPMTAPGRCLDAQAVARVRGEFAALPGLALTAEQARLLFELDRELCESVLHALVGEGFLHRTPHGAFRRPL